MTTMIIDIVASDANIPPGETGQAVNTNCKWFRVVAGDTIGQWKRVKHNMTYLDIVKSVTELLAEDEN